MVGESTYMVRLATVAGETKVVPSDARKGKVRSRKSPSSFVSCSF